MKMFWLPMQVTGSRLSESVGRPRTMRLAVPVEPDSSAPSSAVVASLVVVSSVSPPLLQPASGAMAASAPSAAAPLTKLRLLSLIWSIRVSLMRCVHPLLVASDVRRFRAPSPIVPPIRARRACGDIMNPADGVIEYPNDVFSRFETKGKRCRRSRPAARRAAGWCAGGLGAAHGGSGRCADGLGRRVCVCGANGVQTALSRKVVGLWGVRPGDDRAAPAAWVRPYAIVTCGDVSWTGVRWGGDTII